MSANVDVATYLRDYTVNIKTRQERELFVDIVFKGGTPRARCMPFDYNWHIFHDYDEVANALCKLSSILIQLQATPWTDPEAIYLKNHVNHLFTLLKEGLIAYGCKEPPERLDVATTADTVKEIARQIVDMTRGQLDASAEKASEAALRSVA